MPYTLEEYQAAQSFMVMKMQQESSTSVEGVEVLENRPFENEELGKGQYTRKVRMVHQYLQYGTVLKELLKVCICTRYALLHNWLLLVRAASPQTGFGV